MTASGRRGSTALTWLFVPGDRPERFARAGSAGAEEVIVDLEDAVAPGAKEAAREHVVSWLGGSGSAWVRINAADTSWWADDVAATAGLPGLRGLVVPKADRASITATVERSDAPLVALVESARGVLDAADVAAAQRVVRLAFGSIDYAVDIGADETWDALLLARSTLVLASRAAGLPGPVDGVTTAVRDDERVTADARASRRIGFAGKLCIHPAQLPAVVAAYAPSAEEIAWAHRVVEAADGGTTVQVDGAMVDRPVLLRAQGILRRGAR